MSHPVTEKDIDTFEGGIVLGALALYAAAGQQPLAVEVARAIGARMLEENDGDDGRPGDVSFAEFEAKAKEEWSKTVWAAAAELNRLKKGGRG
jgi:hypothetical protein